MSFPVCPFPGGPVPVMVTPVFTASQNPSPSSPTTITFTGLNFGSAFLLRQILVFVTATIGAGTFAPTVKIGGVIASQLGTWQVANANTHLGLFTVPLASGTSGTVEVDSPGLGMFNCSVVGYQASRPFAAAVTPQVGPEPMTAILDVPSYGAVLAGVNITSQNASPSATWSGLNEDYDFDYGAFGRWGTTTASLNFTFGNPSLSVVAAITGGTLNTGAALFAVLT